MTLPDLNHAELKRYARHVTLPEIGVAGQRRLKSARVLCVGTGGLGSPLALYLAAAGVGTIGVVDDDVVDESNLQRQVLHGTSALGRPKVDSALERLTDVNPHVRIERHQVRLTSTNALEILDGYDVVVDGTDNFPTRYLVNDACVLLGKPNVYGSVFRWEGQLSVFGVPGAPCYRCLFREPPPPGLVPNCAEGGVMGVLPGIMGSAQALETLKILLGVGTPAVGRLLIFDALDFSWREVALRRNPQCPVCGDHPTQTELIDYEVFCGVDPLSVAAETPGVAVPDLSPEEVRVRLDRDDPPLLIDVRDGWEWGVGNLSALGARLVPLSEVEARLGEIPRDRAIVMVCRSGQRSRRAAELLARSGHTDVSNLRGGLLAWTKAIDPDLSVV